MADERENVLRAVTNEFRSFRERLLSQQRDQEYTLAAERELAARTESGVDQPSTMERVLTAGAVIVGGYAAARRFLARDIVIKTLGRATDKVKGVTSPITNFVRGAMDEVLSVKRAGRQGMSNIELVRDLQQGIELNERLRLLRGPAAATTQARLLQEDYARTYSDLRRPGLSTLRPTTVADVFANPDVEKSLSSDAVDVLKRARSLGIARDDMSLTTGYGGLFMDAKGRQIDVRWIKPTNVLKTIHDLAANIRVPWTGIRPVDIITSVLHPFGRGAFAGEIGTDLKIGPGVRTGSTFNWVAGGNVYSLEGNKIRRIAKGYKLASSHTRSAQSHIARYNDVQTFGAYDLRRKVASGQASLWERIQATLGIGPSFQTQKPFWRTGAVDPYLRRTQGELLEHQWVSRRDSYGGLLGWARRAADYYRASAKGGKEFAEQYMNEAVPRTRPVSFLEKILAYMGKGRGSTVVRRGAKAPFKPQDIPGGTDPGVPWAAGWQPVPRTRPVGPGAFGGPPVRERMRNEYYAYRGNFGEAAADVAHLLTGRLNDLLGATTGLGFKTGVGEGTWGGLKAAGANLGRLYGAYLGLSAGVQYADYADSVLEQATGLSVKKGVLQLYAGLRYAQQFLRQFSGVASAAEYLEDLMPKSIDSGASWALRTVGPLAIGLATGGKRGLMLGAAATFMIGGTDISQSPSDLAREFSGDKLVPIRKGRYWMLGRQPFEGGQIDYYAPGWYARAMSDYRFTSTQYGSKPEYYAHVASLPVPFLGNVPLPTPTNLFGLGNLLDGDLLGGGQKYLAEKHRYDRPYPDTPGNNFAQAQLSAQYLSARGPFDAPLGAGERLGEGTYGSLGMALRETSSFRGRMMQAVDNITELGGIHKFLWWDATGLKDSGRPYVASSKSIGSGAREFYDEQIGGAFGLTELYRRFVPTPEKGVNPLPNTMPGWLPGIRSEYEQDRQYHVDFTLGDPYAKLKHGEFRLPGEAYERLHRLHSGTPGIYDPMDRFMILADVAPYSHAFKEYKAIVQGWQKAGVLDSSWSQKVGETLDQVKSKMERYQFVDRRFTGMITDPDPAATSAKYNFLEKGIGGAWEILTHDIVPKIGDTVPIFGPILSDKMLVARSPIEQYLRTQVYGEEFADWRSPWKAWLRPKLDILASQDPGTATLGGAGLGLLGSNPFSAAIIGAMGALYSGKRSMDNMFSNEPYVPDHRQSEWALAEYFDTMRYMKANKLYRKSKSMGDLELAAYYEREVQRTMAGVDYSQNGRGFMSSAMKGLPRNYKGFYIPFSKMPEEARRSVLPYLPEYVQPAFAQNWLMDSSLSQEYRDELSEQYGAVTSASPWERAQVFGSVNGMPSDDWAGWHPDVPMDTVKMKMVDAGAGSIAADIHKFDLYPEHRFRATRFPDIPVPSIDHVRPVLDIYRDTDLHDDLHRAGIQDVRIRRTPRSSRGSTDWDLRYDRTDGLREMVRRYM